MPTAQQRTVVNESQIYATVEGVAGNWSVVTLPGRSVTVTKSRDGGARTEDSSASHPTYGDLTVRRPFKRNRDFAAWRALNDQVGKAYKTITIPIEDEDGVVIDHLTYTGLLMSCTPPSGDSLSSTTAMVEISFSIDSAA